MLDLNKEKQFLYFMKACAVYGENHIIDYMWFKYIDLKKQQSALNNSNIY